MYVHFQGQAVQEEQLHALDWVYYTGVGGECGKSKPWMVSQ
jgi:hypothetical protein